MSATPSQPSALETRAAEPDKRLRSPSAARNIAPILEAMMGVVPMQGKALEIGSGTGEHVVAAAALSRFMIWQPSDPDSAARESIAAWTAKAGAANVLPPLAIDAAAGDWGVAQDGPWDAVVCINMIHIAPWSAAEGLFRNAGKILTDGGVLFLYGPFMVNGAHTSPSNAAFDESLKARNPAWGVRDIADLDALAAKAGLKRDKLLARPANNHVVTYVTDRGR
ncbi:MAG: DUF938 domain-containing protein [Alphaproteobacteria bacterium]|nr:DUF938 domain-containing protein [Alphaproteobacteria bacterium]